MKVLSSAIVCFVACILPAMAAEFELRLGHGAAPDNPRHIIAREFAETVAERTNGRVEIEVHHSESLGSDRQMAEALMLGTLDFSINSQGPMAAYNNQLNAIGLPFLFTTTEQIHRVLDGEIGKDLAKPFERKNMKVLAFWDNGFRHITNNKRPITSADDLKGLMIRTPEDKITIALFEALGADPTPFAFGKLYTALEQRQFDGQENPITNIFYSRLYEVQKYLSLTSHKYECCPFMVSMTTWRKLPDDIRGIIEQAAVEFAIKHRELNNKLNTELLHEMEKFNIVVNTPDTESLRQKSGSVYAMFEPSLGKDLVERMIEASRQ